MTETKVPLVIRNKDELNDLVLWLWSINAKCINVVNEEEWFAEYIRHEMKGTNCLVSEKSVTIADCVLVAGSASYLKKQEVKIPNTVLVELVFSPEQN